MKFFFHPLADKEFEQAVQYYEEHQLGLGLQFSREVYASIRRILQFPNMFSRLSKNSCRCIVNRFPYGIVYQVNAGKLHIIAISHLSRRPGYWKNRI